MRNRLPDTAVLTTAFLLASASFVTAQAPAAPAPRAAQGEQRDVIVVRPDAPGMFVVGDPMRSAGQPATMVKTAFLGVGVSAAPSVLSEQLDLPAGVGLVVEFVEKGSPAEKAGLQAKDVLHRLDEQLLVNPQQLATLIRTFKPSDRVKLTVIRKGDPVTLEATLVEKEMPELNVQTNQAFEFYNSALPMPRGLEPAQIKALAEQGKAAGEAARARVIRVMPGATSKIIKVENGLRIELETRDGRKTVTIQDQDGKEIFTGPYNTPEELEKVPAEYRDRVKSVEEGIELKEVPATSPAQPKAEATDQTRPVAHRGLFPVSSRA